MQQTTVVLVTLIFYKLALIGLGLWANRKTQNEADYFLGGRGLGPWVAAISASASSSSAWTLLGVSGLAYGIGLGAIWLFPACVGGFWLNWYVVAPRLRQASAKNQAITVTEFLCGKSHPWLTRVASAIILFSLLFYVASQFQASGKTFESTFEIDFGTSVVMGSAIILIYTLLGGFWAVSLTDTLQGLVMALTAIILPIAALMAVGGPGMMWQAMGAVNESGYVNLLRGWQPAAGVGFVIGILGIGLGYPGQPHVVNRFMALRDEKATRQGRYIAMGWAFTVYAGMLVLGWCGRILYPVLQDREGIFFEATSQLFPPVIAGIMIAAVLSAIMSTADSQLLVAASSASYDLRRKGASNLAHSRWVVLALCIGATLLALTGSAHIFNKVLFAWSAMGSAFGPLLLVLLFKGPVRPPYRLAAMVSGFVLSVSAYNIAAAKGGVFERVVPFVVAGLIAWWGARREKD